ncbi:MAG: HAMP domain-containing protein, partial [Candidatus Krumholzibacteriota bacterium]|nr:HAMP domain-containing protein [Candidatus Krumholzibacteriota bacterium]
MILGEVHLGVFEASVESAVDDNRFFMTLLLAGIFGVGLLLIMGLVNVFVKPIQTLTDGVRAIGDGTLDGRLNVDGPAEIGAIASVFNEITDKFQAAQNSIFEQEKMQKEMEVAKEIQHSLLPSHKPELSGFDIAPLYQAAAEVGGDYYDFIERPGGLAVALGDVSGKGTGAALMMMVLRATMHFASEREKT